jgi:hypothetical protein
MDTNRDGYTIKEEFDDVTVFFEGKDNKFSFEVSYKGESVYKEDITGFESTILEKTKDFSVEEKWNYFLEFGQKVAYFIEKMKNKQKYTEYQIYGILNGLSKVTKILEDDYKQHRKTVISGISNNDVTQDIRTNDHVVTFLEPCKEGILHVLANSAQIKFANKQYHLCGKPNQFIAWCLNQGYIDPEKGGPDDLTAEYICENIVTGCTLETIKKYIRNAKAPKDIKKKLLSDKTGINPGI